MALAAEVKGLTQNRPLLKNKGIPQEYALNPFGQGLNGYRFCVADNLQHLESDRRFLYTGYPALRDLIVDQVRRLRLRGAHVEALQFGQDALRVWRERLSENDLQVLTMAVEVAIAMYIGGGAADAHGMILQIRPLLQQYTDGDGFKVFLMCEVFYGEDLRAHSQFREALEHDLSVLPNLEAAFGIVDVPQIIRLIDRDFGEARHSVESLFRDMQRQMGQEPLDPEAPFQPRGVPDETITVWADCSTVWKEKHEALLAHATQRAEIEDIPEELRPLVFGLETFVQAWPEPKPGTRLTDLFEGLPD